MRLSECEGIWDWLLITCSGPVYKTGNFFVLLALYMKFPVKREYYHRKIKERFSGLLVWWLQG